MEKWNDNKGEQLRELLDLYFDARSVRAIVVSNQDGLPIATRLVPESKEREYLLSAISSTLLYTGFSVADRLEMGYPLDIKVSLMDGIMIVKKLGKIEDAVCCSIVLTNKANVPYYEIKLREFSKKVESILYK